MIYIRKPWYLSISQAPPSEFVAQIKIIEGRNPPPWEYRLCLPKVQFTIRNTKWLNPKLILPEVEELQLKNCTKVWNSCISWKSWISTSTQCQSILYTNDVLKKYFWENKLVMNITNYRTFHQEGKNLDAKDQKSAM